MQQNKLVQEEKSFVLISNINFEPYLDRLLKSKFSNVSTRINICLINYEEYKLDEWREKIEHSDCIVVLLNFDYLYQNAFNDVFSGRISEEELFNDAIVKCSDLYKYLKVHSYSPILWFSFEDYCYLYGNVIGNISHFHNFIDRVNIKIQDMFLFTDVCIDFKRIIATVGIKNTYNNKGKYRWNSPYSRDLIDAICDEIFKQHLINNGITKKCIILDCDNVLWGGILSEDGIENIYLSSNGLGRSFQDFQRYLLYLYYHGVILTICSKNDMEDVSRMFKEHKEMILKEEHIACFRVNWKNKIENIKEIVESLNIGLESVLFIDDSDFEIQAVKQLLPEVVAIKYERDSVYSHLYCLNLKNDVSKNIIKQRNITYQTNCQRDILKNSSETFEDYLNALEINIDIHIAQVSEYSRISELTQKTNKFTNGTRYTIKEIKERMDSDQNALYSVSVSDRFSDFGIVGVFEIERNILTLFSLSCRILGRNIEKEMAKTVLNKYKIKEIKYKSTGKNSSIKEFLKKEFSEANLIDNC